jgi:hypothetical protein
VGTFVKNSKGLFIPNKAQTPVRQPTYGTDMRAIETWLNGENPFIRRIIAGTNITTVPATGFPNKTGAVTVNATGGGGGGTIVYTQVATFRTTTGTYITSGHQCKNPWVVTTTSTFPYTDTYMSWAVTTTGFIALTFKKTVLYFVQYYIQGLSAHSTPTTAGGWSFLVEILQGGGAQLLRQSGVATSALITPFIGDAFNFGLVTMEKVIGSNSRTIDPVVLIGSKNLSTPHAIQSSCRLGIWVNVLG